MNKFTIFTIVYFLLAMLLIFNFNNDLFVTDQNGTAIILAIIYAILTALFFTFKGIKKLFSH